MERKQRVCKGTAHGEIPSRIGTQLAKDAYFEIDSEIIKIHQPKGGEMGEESKGPLDLVATWNFHGVEVGFVPNKGINGTTLHRKGRA